MGKGANDLNQLVLLILDIQETLAAVPEREIIRHFANWSTCPQRRVAWCVIGGTVQEWVVKFILGEGFKGVESGHDE